MLCLGGLGITCVLYNALTGVGLGTVYTASRIEGLMLNKQSIAQGTVNLMSPDGLHRTILEVILGKWLEKGGEMNHLSITGESDG